jgi:2-polyprenyl-3-methyl-5-hydroxy-6-metoxy-1,4-benzoquinol methylase
MNWAYLRRCAWIDTRARFVASVPQGGALLDLGSSDGETLRHIAELRPDFRLHAVDLGGQPEAYPKGCQFQRANLETDHLGWSNASMDAITCMHLIEHLQTLSNLLSETARLLKPGGKVYFETPHTKTTSLPSLRGSPAGPFTLNFYDDPTHVRPIAISALAQEAQTAGLKVIDRGTSRNWLFAASYPVFRFLPASRKKFTSRVHWLGWSAYLVAQK